MSFYDTIYVIAGFTALIIVGMLMAFVMPKYMEAIGPGLPNGTQAQIEEVNTRTVNFLDASFATLFFIFMAVSIGLTIMVASHPVALALWLLMNITTFIIWDAMNDFITSIEATPLNTGAMDTAINFFQTGIPKAIVVINVLMGIVLFAKRGIG